MSRMIKKISLWMAVIVVLGLLSSFASADVIGGSGFGAPLGGIAAPDGSAYTMTVGETITVKGTIGNKDEWTVTEGSDCVSLGVQRNGSMPVTGLKEGTAVIRHTYDKKGSETFTITVEPAQGEKQLYLTSSHSGKKVHRGEKITLTAHVIGYEEYDYEIIWQYSEDGGVTFTDAGSSGEVYTFKETKENVNWLWRFMLVEK